MFKPASSRWATTGLLLVLMAVSFRSLVPFVSPPLLVHPDGYVEVCSWDGGFERLLLNSAGERVESRQPLVQVQDCLPAPLTSLPEVLLRAQALDQARSQLLPYRFIAEQTSAALLPPTRAPPLLVG